MNGQDGSVTFNSGVILVTNWDGDDETPDLDTTNTGSGGFEENIAGVSKATANTTFPLPSTGVSLTTGTSAELSLQLGDSDLTFSGTFRLKTVKYSNPAKGVVTATASWVSNGSYTVG